MSCCRSCERPEEELPQLEESDDPYIKAWRQMAPSLEVEDAFVYSILLRKREDRGLSKEEDKAFSQLSMHAQAAGTTSSIWLCLDCYRLSDDEYFQTPEKKRKLHESRNN